ncbi:MAG: cytochrome c oxidase subunit II [Actinomycetota bacterium]|nr:cytochrome c oxidase subunit II [Actinomycetota bacterium]
MRRGRTARRVASLVSLGFFIVLTACAQNAPQDTFHNLGGPVARKELNLSTPVFLVAAIIFFLVEGALVYATIRFRARSDRDVPVQVHGNRVLEVTWTLIPAVILAAIAVPTIGTIFSLASTPSGPNVVRVDLTARQWWWEYKYPDLGVVTANEMHIPLGKNVAIKLRSVDVIHSFWVPRLAGKQDVIPGRTNDLYFSADKAGTYLGQCAEFCALSHANMRLRVIAEPQAKFDAWVQQQKADAIAPTGGDAAHGMDLLLKNQCIFCHTIRGTQAAGKVGPDLTHVAGRMTFAGATFDFTTDNLIKWVSDAPAMKPGAKMGRGLADYHLTPDDVRAIVAYLESLK